MQKFVQSIAEKIKRTRKRWDASNSRHLTRSQSAPTWQECPRFCFASAIWNNGVPHSYNTRLTSNPTSIK